MPRSARIVAPGYFYHITQRGNNRQVIFCDDVDRMWYLKIVEHYSVRVGVEVFAFCLMNNHVHFVARPDTVDGLARTFRCAHMRYAQYFNKKYRRSGHVWQGRYFSCLLDEGYLATVVKYVERNPVRAKLVKKAWDWIWSSAGYHVGADQSQMKLADITEYITVASWRQFLDKADDSVAIDGIRESTRVGNVLANSKALVALEKSLDRKLQKRRPGRPLKQEK